MTHHNDNKAGFETDRDRGPWQQMPGGRFWPMDPREEDIRASDILHNLAQVNRFGGSTDAPISVAQHSVQCAMLAWRAGYNYETQYALLMHDAAEAYIGDMQRPLKSMIPEFKKIEHRIFEQIRNALEIPYCDEHTIKFFDNMAWMWEKRDLFKTAEPLWPHTPDIELPEEITTAWSWELAEERMTEIYVLMRRELCLKP